MNGGPQKLIEPVAKMPLVEISLLFVEQAISNN